MTYSIGEMAARLGIATSTLRYYDREGLLPSIQRTESGIRVFTDQDYEWLQLIECLKQTGMPLKDIRTYITMVQEGDSTLDARLQMFDTQRQRVREQMTALQKALDKIEFKCWFYETAKQCGTSDFFHTMPPEAHPELYRNMPGKKV